MPYCDLVLFDLKIMDPVMHRKWTGRDNGLILENLQHIAEGIRKGERSALWIRTPLIPDATATNENIEAIGTYIQKHLTGVVERWELCAFNNLCAEKYQKLDRSWAMRGAPLITRDEGGRLMEIARSSSGLPARRMFLKGRMGQTDRGLSNDIKRKG